MSDIVVYNNGELELNVSVEEMVEFISQIPIKFLKNKNFQLYLKNLKIT